VLTAHAARTSAQTVAANAQWIRDDMAVSSWLDVLAQASVVQRVDSARRSPSTSLGLTSNNLYHCPTNSEPPRLE